MRQVGVEPNHVLLIRQTPPTGWALAQVPSCLCGATRVERPSLMAREVPAGAPGRASLLGTVPDHQVSLDPEVASHLMAGENECRVHLNLRLVSVANPYEAPVLMAFA